MGFSFRHWTGLVRQAIQHQQQEESAQKHIQRSVTEGMMSTTKFLKNMNQRSVGKSFRIWHKATLLIVERARQRCLHLLSMMENSATMKLRLGWRKWISVVQLQAKRESTTCKLMVRMCHSSLRTGYSRWRAYTIEARGQEMTWKANGRLLVSVLRKLVSSAKLSGWLRWRAIHMHCKAIHEHKLSSLSRLGSLVSHMTLQDLSRGFRSWKRFAMERIAHEAKVKKTVSMFVKVLFMSYSFVSYLPLSYNP